MEIKKSWDIFEGDIVISSSYSRSEKDGKGQSVRPSKYIIGLKNGIEHSFTINPDNKIDNEMRTWDIRNIGGSDPRPSGFDLSNSVLTTPSSYDMFTSSGIKMLTCFMSFDSDDLPVTPINIMSLNWNGIDSSDLRIHASIKKTNLGTVVDRTILVTEGATTVSFNVPKPFQTLSLTRTPEGYTLLVWDSSKGTLVFEKKLPLSQLFSSSYPVVINRDASPSFPPLRWFGIRKKGFSQDEFERFSALTHAEFTGTSRISSLEKQTEEKINVIKSEMAQLNANLKAKEALQTTDLTSQEMREAIIKNTFNKIRASAVVKEANRLSSRPSFGFGNVDLYSPFS